MEDKGAFINAADYPKILFTDCTWAEDVGSTRSYLGRWVVTFLFRVIS
jgi:hypothetical protein